MRRPIDHASVQRSEIAKEHAMAIESDRIDRALEAIQNSLAEGNFMERDLWTLLIAVETRHLVIEGQAGLPKLTAAQLAACKATAARMIQKHCGGKVQRAGVTWRSEDGVKLSPGIA
jgi:hypothetical protein